MKLQWVRAAIAIAAGALAAGCATTSSAPGPTAHVNAPSMPSTLSRVEIAQNFEISSARPLAVAAEADPSFAIAHEGTGLQPVSGKLTRHAGAPLEGLALLAAAELPEGWAYDRDRDQAVRHAKSGLSCPLAINIEEENKRFLLRELQAYDDKDLDISCNYSTDAGVALRIYASYWPEMSLDESIASAVAAIGQRFNVKGVMPAPVITMEAEGDNSLFKDLETPQAAGFDIGEVSGAPYKTSLWLVKTYGWHVKARATYPQSDQTSEIVSAIMFAFSHLSVRAKNIDDPVARGGEV